MAVRMYTLSTCPWCRKAKQYFTDKNVPFEFIDVDLLEDGEEKERVTDEVYDLSGGLQYPVVVIGERVVTGYNPSRYEDALKVAADGR